jgi:hypothetical protein
MLKLKIWHWIGLIIFIPFVLGSMGCPWFQKKTEPPPPSQGCGVGTGDYEFNLVDSVPARFDCNDSGRFVITLRPKINPSYGGTPGLVFNRLYFVLDGVNNIHISNYVEFLSGNTADQQLEWGGSVPTGDYEVRGRMKNIQLNSTCPESLYKNEYKKLGTIHITEFSNPEKVMNIEYDCQSSDTSYDVFLSPSIEENMNIAFNIANTTYNLMTYSTDLDPELVLHTVQGVAEYIFAYKKYEDEMFLCGIKGLKDEQGEFLDSILGTTHIMENFVPTCYTGSLVAVKTCIDFAAPQYKLDYNDLVTATVIHELGHQRAIAPGHTPGIGPKFCIMNEAPIINPPHPYDAITFANPHFCQGCITKIKNVTW